MEKNKMKKTVWGASVAVALTTSTALGVSAYQSGIDFHPSETEDTFRANQVRFDDNNDVKGRDNTTEQNESEFLEKDNNADEGNRPQEQNNADYLFEREQLRQNFSDSVALNDGTADASAVGGNADSTDAVYDFTDDRSQADVILNGGTGGSGDGNIGGGQGTSEPTQPTEPTEPTNPTQPSDSNNNSSSSSNNDESNNTTPTPEPTPVTPEPTPGYGDASLDPDTDKTKPDSFFVAIDYVDGALSEEDETVSIIIAQPDSSDAALYSGQKNVSALTIFNALETYAQKKNDWQIYLFGKDHFGNGEDNYIWVNAVWIDGTEYRFDDKSQTIDIPEDAETMKIEVSYRFSKNSNEWKTKTLDYKLEQTRLLVLSEALQDKGQKIDMDTVLNRYSGLITDTTNPPIGTNVDLYYYQRSLLGEERLDTLFPGWRENGELVPWEYPVTAGRHVLEPAARVSLDSSYVVSVKTRWIDTQSTKFTRQTTKSNQDLTFMQTLTDYTGKYAPVLAVPKYVQAVDFAADNHLKSVEYLRLSDTVRYVDTDMENLKVNKGYQLSGNHPDFGVTSDGILTNAEGTEYLGIPYNVTRLTIPDGIEKVKLPKNTQIRQLVLETEHAANLPEIDYGGMTSGTIIVPDAVLLDFVSANGNALAGTDIAVRSVGQIVKGDAVLSDDEKTLQSVFSINKIYTVPESITKIAAYAFESAPNTTRVLLPNHTVALEKDTFANSIVDTILCRTEAQANEINQQLAEWGLSETIHAIALQISKEGSTYYVNGNESVLLYGGSAITEFSGLETAQSGETVKITEIADGAFENSEALQWAMLAENVTEIGARAFYNCSALEGVLIENKDTITIGDKALDQCPSLYFVASNAANANLGDYQIETCNKASNGVNLTQLFATKASGQLGSGYTPQWQYFDSAYGSGLAVYDIGSTKMLYALDAGGNPRIGIRSGKTLTGEVTLPVETIELFSQAMFGTEGAYTLNWEDLSLLQYIDDYVFAYTGLEGSVTTNIILFDKHAFSGTNITDLTCSQLVREVDELAFADCKKLTFVNWSQGFDWNGFLYTNLFYGCDALKRVEINGFNPPKLALFGLGYPFVFNSDWTEEEEAEYIVFPEELAQDERTMQDFVKKWRYAMLGYMTINDDQPYDLLYSDIFWKEIPFDVPYEERFAVADVLIKEKLLAMENRIRDILGAEHATEPSEFYPYRISGGYITLIGAPSNITSVFLGSDTLDIPDDWCLDYVGKGAFANTKNLESVMFDNGFAGFEQDAFQGVESDTLRLSFFDITPPALLLEQWGKPFSFGIDIEKLHINIYAFGDDSIFVDYIEKWVYPLAGYEDYTDMFYAFLWDAIENEGVTSEEEIHAKMTEILLPLENKLRSVIWSYDMDFMPSTLPKVDHLSFTLGFPSSLPDTDEGEEGEEGETDSGDSDGGDIWGDNWGFPDLTPDYFEDTDENQSGTGSADTADRVDSADTAKDTADSTVDTPADTDPAQVPIVLPDLVIERPVIVTIDIPLSALQTGSQTTEETKEEPKDTPKDGEGESTVRGAEEGGAE